MRTSLKLFFILTTFITVTACEGADTDTQEAEDNADTDGEVDSKGDGKQGVRDKKDNGDTASDTADADSDSAADTDSEGDTETGKAEDTDAVDVSETGSCCETNDAPGCDDAEVQECVCNGDPSCCEEEWDIICVMTAEACGAECEAKKGDCCEAHATGGCNDPEVESCICGLVKECCEEWDEFCVSMLLADNVGCGTCKGDCCEEHATPGCRDKAVETCVCEDEGATECCTGLWDVVCVLAAELRCDGCS